MPQETLNQSAMRLADALTRDAERLRLRVEQTKSGVRLIDAGIGTLGSNEAGCRIADITMAGLGHAALVPSAMPGTGAAVQTTTDAPVQACLGSQYAGWQIADDKYFAMGSGPMRALATVEPIFTKLGGEKDEVAVGVLETPEPPPDDLASRLAEQCGVQPARLTLILAPTASLVGTVQVVARSVETAMHQLAERDFPLDRIVSGYGLAPLPPVAHDDLTGIGRTNDAILYGAHATFWVQGKGLDLAALAPRITSSASPEYGRPFLEIFRSFDCDFYKIDPHLFSPARVTLVDIDTGEMHCGGQFNVPALEASFGK